MKENEKKTLIQSFFDVNHPVWQMVEKLFDLMLLNLLTTLASLPLITLGAAKLALQASLWEMDEFGKIKVWSTYWRQFALHWKRGFILSVVEIGVTGFCLLDLYLVWGQSGLVFDGFRAFCIAIFLFSQLLWFYAYPLASRYCFKWSGLFLQAILLLGKELALTFKVSLAYVLFVAIMLYSGLSLIICLICFLSFGYAALSYLFIRELASRINLTQ